MQNGKGIVQNTGMARIAVIEDSTEVQALIVSELRLLAYEVRSANDGEQGLTLCQSWAPDMVILDVMLPAVNGIEVLRRLRGSGFQAPILLLTARDSEADRVAGLELGADDYVVKPFSLRELWIASWISHANWFAFAASPVHYQRKSLTCYPVW